ncbi:MAG: 3-phosphoshikimate 1-carboxyvinyltransferase [Myxococcaceae bacterium]|nr:3-phosphoshikimate 1-carboxyvinyltransferase [Myxococcaceae bacterium]
MPEVLVPPVSKSDAHRALVLAELCEGQHEPLLSGLTELPRDVEVLSRGLRTLRGGGGDLDCLDAGAPFRFLVTQAALKPHTSWRFVGSQRLGERPHEALLQALRQSLGVAVRHGEAFWPLTVETGARPVVTTFRVSGVESSQFTSSLLLGAARVVREGRSPVTVEIDGAATSAGYVALTVAWMSRFGFVVGGGENRLVVTGWRAAPAPVELPGDWSSLTYLLPLSWRSGVGVRQVDLTAAHPDRAFATLVEAAGLRLETREGLTWVRGALRCGLEVDASVCPDAVPALVAMALVAPAPSTFVRCGVLRLKESDRLDGLVTLVRLAGGRAEVEGERLTVTPPATARGGVYDGRDDHRLVMAATVAASLLGVTIPVRGADAVAKSFPGFWREVAKVGITPAEAT